MCFSAPVSFSAAALLAGLGVWTIAEHRHSPKAAASFIPLMFSLQQLFEGLIWRALAQEETPSLFIFGYLTLALVVWPFFFPSALYLFEDHPRRRRYLSYLMAMGCALSLSNLYHLLLFPISVQPFNCSLFYHYESLPQGTPYALLVCGPFFLSSKPFMLPLGLLGLFALAITRYAELVTFFSIWCFFAASISAFLAAALREGSSLCNNQRSSLVDAQTTSTILEPIS